ncbi:MAG: LysR family transcriptional regulator [Pseudobdellovibrionaceae bacterium]
MQISIDQARALCAIVETGGYTKAAENLHKSHSSLVYLLKGFEEQCGFSIFDRKAYRNTLTPAGRRVYQACLEILGKVDELGRLCEQLNQGWEPSIRVVFDGILPFEPFLKIYKKFKSDNVPTVVQTYADYLQDVEKSFNTLEADLMISVLPVENQNLEAVPLKSFKSYLVAHKNHSIQQSSKKWSLEELHQFYFLTIRGSNQKFGLNTSEFEKSASFFMSDFSAKKEAIMKELGFGWLPEHMIENELKNHSLLPVKWERKSTHEVRPIIYIRKQAVGGRAISLFVELLKSFK